MNASDLSSYIGNPAIYRCTGASGWMDINVTILDARERFGRIDVLVTPMAGSSSMWISLSSVRYAEGSK